MSKTGRQCYLEAKAKYDELFRCYKDQNTIALKAREFIFELAKSNEWITARYFLNEFTNHSDFPIERMNLVGNNDETVYWIIADKNSEAAKANPDIGRFVMHLSSYCRENVKDLADRSDDYYYSCHPEVPMAGLIIDNCSE